MPHIYIDQVVEGDSLDVVDPEKLHHLTVVLRARQGEAISLFNNRGYVYSGHISRLEKQRLSIQIESRRAVKPELVQLTIACAIPKGPAMDEIVDSSTQLGVNFLIPLLTERVISRLEDAAKKMERWRKIALNAAEQCHGSHLLEISSILNLEKVLELTEAYPLKVIPTLEGPSKPLKDTFPDSFSGRIAILIGPEGDFTPAEVKTAIRAGFQPVSLGNNTLRVATAAAAAAAFIRLRYAD